MGPGPLPAHLGHLAHLERSARLAHLARMVHLLRDRAWCTWRTRAPVGPLTGAGPGPGPGPRFKWLWYSLTPLESFDPPDRGRGHDAPGAPGACGALGTLGASGAAGAHEAAIDRGPTGTRNGTAVQVAVEHTTRYQLNHPTRNGVRTHLAHVAHSAHMAQRWHPNGY